MKSTNLNYVHEYKMVKVPDGVGGEIECPVHIFKLSPQMLREMCLDESPHFASKKHLNEYIKQNMTGIKTIRKTHKIVLKNIEKLLEKIQITIDENGVSITSENDDTICVPDSEKKLLEIQKQLLTIIENEA